MEYSIYIDESCHLENDKSNKMVLGCVWLSMKSVRRVGAQLRDLKAQFGYGFETKWNRVSPARIDMYRAILQYFWDEPELHYRGVVVTNKSILDHARFSAGNQDHFYYKMVYLALTQFVDSKCTYDIYVDRKDSWSQTRINVLREILQTSLNDLDNSIIHRIQQIRSHESQLIQMCDLISGAISYCNRGLTTSPAKLELVDLLQARAMQRLDRSSYLSDRKFNIFMFVPQK